VVRLSPLAVGASLGTFTLSADGESVEVALQGVGRRAPECPASGPCWQSAFDSETGGCVESVLPDATACSPGNLCLEGASCVAGECLGSARSCDDADRCTADACDPLQGCVHLELASKCPAPADPCKVAACDASSGCGVADAPDGTACGAADCITAQVCLAGRCKTVAVPEGASCAAQSPCQAKGVCRAQVCEQPAASPLVVSWSYTTSGSRDLYFNGLADAQANLYGAECSTAAGCDLLSVTASGFPRYRVALSGAPRSSPSSAEPGLLVLVDGLVVSALSGSGVEARHAQDGSAAWSVDLRAQLPTPTGGPPIDLGNFGPIVDDGHGGLYVRGGPLGGRCGNGVDYDSLFALSASSGALRWRYSGQFSALASDEAGNAYATASLPADGGAFSGLVSLTAAGSERWRVANGGYGYPLSVSGGRVVMSDGLGSLYRTTDGSAVLPADSGSGLELVTGETLLGPATAYAIGQKTFTCCQDCPCPNMLPELGLRAERLSDAAALWQVSLSVSGAPYEPNPWLSAPALAANGDLLFALSPNPYFKATLVPARLQARTAAGDQRFSCELPGAAPYDAILYDGAAVLLPGRWVVAVQELCFSCVKDPPPALKAFEVPGYDLGQSGWVAPGGSNRRSGRPR
ncbi:MAG: hypothetical protein ACYC8T_34030, partial [Myxococcaceae bacterium]